jgi:hypothetical protein
MPKGMAYKKTIIIIAWRCSSSASTLQLQLTVPRREKIDVGAEHARVAECQRRQPFVNFVCT